MNELQQLTAMLSRAGIGHGLRRDYNPPGEAVQVECDDSEDDREWTVTEFVFDDRGLLKGVFCYPGEEG